MVVAVVEDVLMEVMEMASCRWPSKHFDFTQKTTLNLMLSNNSIQSLFQIEDHINSKNSRYTLSPQMELSHAYTTFLQIKEISRQNIY